MIYNILSVALGVPLWVSFDSPGLCHTHEILCYAGYRKAGKHSLYTCCLCLEFHDDDKQPSVLKRVFCDVQPTIELHGI